MKCVVTQKSLVYRHSEEPEKDIYLKCNEIFLKFENFKVAEIRKVLDTVPLNI